MNDTATKSVRLSQRTHRRLQREAQRRGMSMDEITAASLRALRQVEMGRELATELREDEREWLDADLS